MRTANKRYLIILVNVAVMLGIVGFVLLYAQRTAGDSISTEVSQFETATVTMEQVTTNYLKSEQDICNVWERYIDSNPMTIDEAISFIRSSHVSPDDSAHIVFTDDDSLEGLSTRPRTGSEDYYDVSYKAIGLPIQLDKLDEQDGTVNVSRSYTNPMNGVQSLAFCDKITLVDSGDRSKQREAVLLRVIPTEKLQEKWVFPSERYKDAEVSLIDSDCNYIIKGHDYKNSNFIEFYKSYNQVDVTGVEDLKERLASQSGSFFMNNSRGEECLIAYSPISENRGWTILNYIPSSSLHRSTVDWFLVGGVAFALLFLLIFDMALMNWFNARLDEAAKEAEAANRAKSDFLSAMSHDIRTPMNAILGLTTIAQLNVDDQAVVKDSLRKIELASNHLLTLINDILDISKVESGKLTLSPVSFSIAESAENLVNISQPMVKEKNIDFNFRISPIEYEYLYADELRLNQIFINILSNAIKYTNPGGRVTIDMSETKSGQPGKVHLTYRVEDTGIGMSPEYMKKMYEPFSRQTDSRVNTIQGTGLGLAITKKMVDLMGGTIDCQSEQNKGTCFAIELDIPIAERQLDEMKLEPIDVLVVDDDEVLLETAGDTLRTLGARAETSSSGADALRKISQRHELGKDYDVVIIDWKMPEMDGLELTRRIRQIAGDNLPILLISAYDWSDIEESARDAGANGFVSKPLFRSTLYEKITEVLGIETEMTAPDEDNSDLAGMHVLVAEDNDVNWEIIFMLLEMYGIESERAVNGQIAVEMAEANPDKYDLIFMDIQMPVMNGLDATKMIRASKNEKCAQLPIIAMTADAFSENVAECLAVGMNGHIAKPVDIKIVLKEIRKIKESKK